MPACLLPAKSMRRRLIVPFHPRVVPSRQPLIEIKGFLTSLYLVSLGPNLPQRPVANEFSKDPFALNSK
jgi:hypothetical protein